MLNSIYCMIVLFQVNFKLIVFDACQGSGRDYVVSTLFMDKLHTMGKSSQQKIIRSSRECWAARFPGAGERTGGTDNVTD